MSKPLSTEKRNRFLSAALSLFVQNGIHNTSTAAIAKKAGTAAGTLFLYFPTKQDLIDELVLSIGRDQSSVVKQQLTSLLSPQETFQVIWDTTINWFRQNPEAFLFFTQIRETGIISQKVVQSSQQFFDYYFTAIQKGLDQQVIKPYPIDLIGEFLYHDIVAVMYILLREESKEKQATLIHLGFHIFWDGIRN